ncbi:hypothetical protein QSJ19_17280 [Gordonia sp. ABSL11-1]|uniref:hypothetical protein n=1 Tax=Gordonia sp. ABSL11-1 TaxID=3053924 RepID=UPI0025726B7E|nr:hypothetical protein [Gordonia sp. ABSL11-1]MDL9947298.1 hypothetical protein [Gordonia sp. ABSL11-1]
MVPARRHARHEIGVIGWRIGDVGVLVAGAAAVGYRRLLRGPILTWGGAYTYDWIENLLGLHMHSTDRVRDEFQHQAIGEVIALGPNRMRIAVADPAHAFATRSEDGTWVWAFTLVDIGDGTTRLISRNRFRLPRLREKIGMLPMEPGSLIMERKMLQGIRERAETLARREEVGSA